MPDPLGLIGDPNALHGAKGLPSTGGPNRPGDPAFGNLLKEEIGRVNALQQDAQVAAEDFAAGKDAAVGRLVGHVMKASGGQADAAAVRSSLIARLRS